MTRQDINYTMAHVLVFVALYAGSMAKLPKGTYFDWGSLSTGLMGTLGTGVAVNMTGSKKDPTTGSGLTPVGATSDHPVTSGIPKYVADSTGEKVETKL